jgi:hypothetical protein
MQIEKRDGSEERSILIGMITNKRVLGPLSAKWEPERFRSRWANLIGGWCVKYFQKYDRAPAKGVEGLFQSWASKSKDAATIELVESFLESLSGEYAALAKEQNSGYLIDMAAGYFNRVRLERLVDGIQGDLSAGDVEAAEKRLMTSSRVELGLGAGVDVLHDREAIRQAFESKSDPLIVFPGALGSFFGDALERDGLIAFMGPEKRGKTWWLLHIAWQALLQRRKVAFFEVGDMSQNQIMRRFMVRASGHPMKAGKQRRPKSIERNGEPVAHVEFIEKTFTESLSWQKAWASCQHVLETKVKTDQPLLKVSCHPNSAVSVFGIQNILQEWKQQGWVCDVLVIDYADILANPLSGSAETREQINTTWKQLRALSQAHHCLVVTATQTDAASYDARVIGKRNFSEDKRKLAHVTGMVGLNATPEEQELGIMRLNWVVLRESEFTEGKCVHVAGNFGLGNPAMVSTF